MTRKLALRYYLLDMAERSTHEIMTASVDIPKWLGKIYQGFTFKGGAVINQSVTAERWRINILKNPQVIQSQVINNKHTYIYAILMNSVACVCVYLWYIPENNNKRRGHDFMKIIKTDNQYSKFKISLLGSSWSISLQIQELLISEISFNKNTTSQGDMGIRRVSKEYKEASKNDKTEA